MRQINDITTAAKVNDAVKRCKALAQRCDAETHVCEPNAVASWTTVTRG
jgi:hypothetical protein